MRYQYNRSKSLNYKKMNTQRAKKKLISQRLNMKNNCIVGSFESKD